MTLTQEATNLRWDLCRRLTRARLGLTQDDPMRVERVYRRALKREIRRAVAFISEPLRSVRAA